MLRDRNILYAPDYVANAGGVFNGCSELLGWEPERDLDAMCRDAWRWQSRNPDGYPD